MPRWAQTRDLCPSLLLQGLRSTGSPSPGSWLWLLPLFPFIPFREEVGGGGTPLPGSLKSCLVHPFPTIPGSTVAGDLVLIVLKVKLIVIGQL